MSSLHFQLVTPERTVLAEDLTSLSCPTKLGQITVLPEHIPLVAELAAGELIARSVQKGEHYIHVDGGFITVKPGNQVVVLADAAEHSHEIDLKLAEEARDKAQEKLAGPNLSEEEYVQVAAALERSLSRINVARKRAHRRTSPITGEGVLHD